MTKLLTQTILGLARKVRQSANFKTPETLQEEGTYESNSVTIFLVRLKTIMIRN